MKRSLTAGIAAVLMTGGLFAAGNAAAAQPAFTDGPMLGSSDVGCTAQGCTSPLVKFLLVDLLGNLDSLSAGVPPQSR
ncbi:hypothetical protein [Nocardia africana]|uniref:Secreted protein n=1 Tax=Nocardia africana TaxID=134964 RepID=A0A378X4K8_9NOCA|nr:hypothetical protein [Nocardia africana]MCC3317753.1 hypothetical protein [Nocardia africana]SUA48516.1 Uncharacterised protein [Nocardia africana]